MTLSKEKGLGVNFPLDRRLGDYGVFDHRMGQRPVQLIAAFGCAMV